MQQLNLKIPIYSVEDRSLGPHIVTIVNRDSNYLIFCPHSDEKMRFVASVEENKSKTARNAIKKLFENFNQMHDQAPDDILGILTKEAFSLVFLGPKNSIMNFSITSGDPMGYFASILVSDEPQSHGNKNNVTIGADKPKKEEKPKSETKQKEAEKPKDAKSKDDKKLPKEEKTSRSGTPEDAKTNEELVKDDANQKASAEKSKTVEKLSKNSKPKHQDEQDSDSDSSKHMAIKSEQKKERREKTSAKKEKKNDKKQPVVDFNQSKVEEKKPLRTYKTGGFEDESSDEPTATQANSYSAQQGHGNASKISSFYFSEPARRPREVSRGNDSYRGRNSSGINGLQRGGFYDQLSYENGNASTSNFYEPVVRRQRGVLRGNDSYRGRNSSGINGLQRGGSYDQLRYENGYGHSGGLQSGNTYRGRGGDYDQFRNEGGYRRGGDQHNDGNNGFHERGGGKRFWQSEGGSRVVYTNDWEESGYN